MKRVVRSIGCSKGFGNGGLPLFTFFAGWFYELVYTMREGPIYTNLTLSCGGLDLFFSSSVSVVSPPPLSDTSEEEGYGGYVFCL